MYYITYSTIKDRGQRLPQTTLQCARNATPVGAALYRMNKSGAYVYIGVRTAPQHFTRAGK